MAKIIKESLSFDDVLINVRYSEVESRSNVDLSTKFLGIPLAIPFVSSNMDTITGPKMAAAMAVNGGIGCLHRFNTIQQNVDDFYATQDLVVQQTGGIFPPSSKPMVSIGIGDKEYERAMALEDAGATHFVIDVAHGAATHVVKQYDRLRSRFKDNICIVVGNFANAQSIKDFNEHVKSYKKPDSYKIGVGSGSMCTTRIVTGCGDALLSSLLDCNDMGINVIADGGIRGSGDSAKALGASANLLMIGGLLAGTEETPGESYVGSDGQVYKEYRGSASGDSYVVQGKLSDHRTPEGVATKVLYKGSVSETITRLTAGLKSSYAYVGASNTEEFKNKVEFIKTTAGVNAESKPHGVK